MKTALRYMWLAGVVLLVAAAGCQRADRVISISPSWAELPSFAQPEPKLSAVVGVEGARDIPRVVIVPRYEEIQLTPEEREALGERDVPVPDALVFYQPPRGPEHGVSPELFQAVIGISGVGGPLTGHEPTDSRFGTHGFAGRYAAEQALVRLGASVGLARDRAADVGGGWGVQVGEGLARQGARRAPRVGR